MRAKPRTTCRRERAVPKKPRVLWPVAADHRQYAPVMRRPLTRFGGGARMRRPRRSPVSGFADYERYDALGLADLVRRKAVSPDDLLEAAIERVEARNQAVNGVSATARK